MIWIYRLLFPFVLVALSPYYVMRMRRRGGDRGGFLHRFGLPPRLPPRRPGVRRIWLQAVSVVQSGSMDRRFFHRLGASRLHRSICDAAASEALLHTFGTKVGVDPELTPGAQLIVIWGANVRTTNIHQFALVQEARKRGARVVVVDVHRSRTAESADAFLCVRPGSDAALALGMMHVIFRDSLADREFLAQRTTGARDLEERAAAWTPERASAACGIPAATIVAFAREYAAASPSFIGPVRLQRHTNGGSTVRALACLPAVTGAWRAPGGGFLLSNSGAFAYDRRVLERPISAPRATRVVNMIELGKALATLDEPPLRALFVYGANPAAVTPDGESIRRGLARDDVFTVVHDIYHTDTAAYADFVLPAPTFLETEDVYTSYWHRYLQYAKPAVEPHGESRSNVELFRALAKRMGFTEPCFDDSVETMIRAVVASGELGRRGIDAEALLRDGRVHVGARRSSASRCARTRWPGDRSGARLHARRGEPRSLAGIVRAISTALDLAVAPCVSQLELRQRSGAARPRATGAAHPSRRRASAASRTATRSWPTIDRGRTQLRAEVTDAVAPGVVVHLSLWWNAFSPGGATSTPTTSATERSRRRCDLPHESRRGCPVLITNVPVCPQRSPWVRQGSPSATVRRSSAASWSNEGRSPTFCVGTVRPTFRCPTARPSLPA